jgi:hypothetical protein
MLEQFRNLLGEPPFGKPVIVVPMGDDFSSRILAGQVLLGAHSVPFLHTDVPDPRIVRDQIGYQVRSVIEDD